MHQHGERDRIVDPHDPDGPGAHERVEGLDAVRLECHREADGEPEQACGGEGGVAECAGAPECSEGTDGLARHSPMDWTKEALGRSVRDDSPPTVDTSMVARGREMTADWRAQDRTVEQREQLRRCSDSSNYKGSFTAARPLQRPRGRAEPPTRAM